MKNTATFRRVSASVALLATALLSLVSQLLAPAFPSGGAAARLDVVQQGGTAAALSAGLFVAAQLPFIVAALGIGHLLRERAPLLSNLGTTLAVIGGFGHAVIGGVSMLEVAMASDSAHRQVLADAVTRFEASPGMLFAALGMLGTVLGLVLLAVGLWRADVSPRWVAPAIGAFLVIEFVASGFSAWASDVSAVIYVVALGALAAVTWQTGDERWALPAPHEVREPVEV
jgi:hypothetical protein